MTTGFNFWDVNPVWSFIIALVAISVALLVANLLIRLIKPLRKALVPASVLGGFILLLFISVYKWIAKDSPIAGSVLEILTYHCLGLGFVATALKAKNKNDNKSTSKSIFNASLITVSGYLIQAIIGLVISVLLFLLIKSWAVSGVLLPMGFGQGPGQAFNWGNIFQQYTTADSIFGSFENGASFGLSVAAMGFVAASIGGIIYLNIQKKKGNIKMVAHEDDAEKSLTLEDYCRENEIPVSGTVDKGSIQFALIIGTYAISFGLIYLVSFICDKSGVNFLINTIKPLFWGFNFIFGSAMASLVKAILNKCEKKGVIKKKYVNNYLMDRLTGILFDVMVVAAIGAIDLSAFKKGEFIIPLLVMSVVATAVTYIYCKISCKKAFPQYEEESFLAMYGMLTGTASTGVILLREIDPYFKTPACTDMLYQAGFSCLFGAPLLLSMGMVAKNWTMLIVWFAVYVVMFVALNIVLVIANKQKMLKE